MVPVAQFAFNFAIYKLQRTQEKKITKAIHHFEDNEAVSGQLRK